MLNMSSSELQSELVLEDDQGRIVAVSDGDSSDAQLLGKLPHRGTYTVIARAQGNDETGEYQLYASSPILVRQDQLDASLPVCFDDGSTCFQYRFQASASQTVTVLVSAGFAPYVEVYNQATGERIASGSGESGINRMEVELPQEGSYKLVVGSVAESADGKFLVSIHDFSQVDASLTTASR